MSISDDIPVPPGSPASMPEPAPSSAAEPSADHSGGEPTATGEAAPRAPDAPRRKRRRRRRKPRPAAAAGAPMEGAAAGGEPQAGDSPAPPAGGAAPPGSERRLHLQPRRHRPPLQRSGAPAARPGEAAGEAGGAPAPGETPRPRRRRRRPPRNRPPQEGAPPEGAASEAAPRARDMREAGTGERPPRDRPREGGERGPHDPAARERGPRDGAPRERGGRDQRRGGKGPRDRKGGPPGRGRDEKKRPEQKLYSTESVVDRGFEDVADEANEGATRRVNWTIVKRMVADQKSGRPVSVAYVLKREEADQAEFPHLAAARGAVNKTIQHPEKLTKSKSEHATTRKK